MSETESVSSPRGQPATAKPNTQAPPQKPGAAKPRGRGFSVFLTIAILVLLAGAVSLAVQRFRMSNAAQLSLAEFARDVAALKSEAEALNARIAMLEKSSSETQSADAQLADLTMRLGTLESEAARAADRDTLAQLQDRIARLESRSPSEMLKIAAATLARANLARAAEDAAPFKPELEALRAAAPDDPAVASLQPFADTGVPTRAMLAARFPDAARGGLAAERESGVDGNFVARVWAGLRGLISVRRVGDLDGMTTQDRLARAQADLDRGDLAGAVMEARAVTGPAAMPLESWLKDAQARLAVNRAVADMNARIVQVLAAPSPPQAPQ